MEWSSVFIGFILGLLFRNVDTIFAKLKSIKIDFNPDESKELQDKKDKKQLED